MPQDRYEPGLVALTIVGVSCALLDRGRALDSKHWEKRLSASPRVDLREPRLLLGRSCPVYIEGEGLQEPGPAVHPELVLG